MLNVYYGGSDRDKDRFMFDMIASKMPSDTVLLVPDQFTLQAERNAFEYMNTDTLLELEIMSRSGFTRRVASQAGEPGGTAVNKYGRYMLLTKLMLESERNTEEESIFTAVRRKRSFITMLNDQISELKQYNITPSELNEIAQEMADDEILHAKLKDIYELYERYEKAIEGKYTDTEDHLQSVIERIEYAPFVSRSIFWIDGFDYLTPKLLSMTEAIVKNAVEVNIILTGEPQSVDKNSLSAAVNASGGEFFEISRSMRRKLRQTAERAGSAYNEEPIPEKYRLVSEPEITVLQAADFYSEAESIAIDISKLVREEGYRYSDIVIICNDADKRGSVFRRVFELYGIPLFMDRKRSITQEPAITFITSMLEVIRKKRRFDDVFNMLKTGFGPISDDECESLEKYCRKYNIRSGRWKKDFVYGLRDEGEEKLTELNEIRRVTDEFIASAEKLFKGKETVRERCEALYLFLLDTADMPARCEMSRIQLESEGLLEEAESTSQIWDTIVEILDQLAEVLGDEVISDEDFNEILSEGFEEVEIGLIPTNNDQVIFGTMQRTRTGNVRAMFAAGANEGVLPEAGRTESLLSDEEKQIITEKHRRISKTDELRVMEQNLAIYKNMTKAAEKLTVSYAKLDTDGSEIRPSELVENVMKLSSTAVRRDYISSGDTDSLLQTPSAAAGHVTSALRKYLNGESLSDVWKAAALVLDGQRQFDTAKAGLLYRGKAERIDRRQVRELFGRGKSKELVLSASALEKYSRCPFSFLITYGLRPEEERRFEVDMRSIGDIYHECMRRVAYELTSDSMEISDPQSRWMTVSTEECRTMTSHYVDEFSERYREGVFNVTQREAYIRERIKEICFETAWLMIQQVRSGRVKAIYFEQRFALRADALFPPIEIDLGDEGSIFIEGMIDRIDIINGWEDGGVSHNYVRIIDYKSGNEKFNLEEVKTGWRLQLMLYLKGAMGAVEDSRPAGVFYFAVKEPRIDVTDTPAEAVEGTVKSGMLKSVKLDGAVLDNVSVITGMDENISGLSDIIPVRRKTDGTFSGSTLLTDEEFDELIDINDSNLESLAENLISGCVHIDPKSGKNVSACRYCGYNSICNHE